MSTPKKRPPARAKKTPSQLLPALYVRLSQATHDRLHAIAQRDRRSLSATISLLIEAAP